MLCFQNSAKKFETMGERRQRDEQGKRTTTTTGKQPYPINWKDPLAIGTTVGALDYATRSNEKTPPQVSINIPQSGQEAYDDPNLRFKPKEENTSI